MDTRCAHCGWPSTESRVLSTHPTSQGWVRYRRCSCGQVSIELVRLADHSTTVDELASATEASRAGARLRG